MYKLLLFFGVLLQTCAVGEDSANVKKTSTENYNPKIIYSVGKPALKYRNPPLGLIIEVKNFSLILNEEQTNQREQNQKRKHNGGKYFRQKIKYKKSDDLDRHTVRDNEKLNLVRNKTIEILKNGMRILNSDDNCTQIRNKSYSRINESLLKKMLSSAASKQDVLLSAINTYKLPVGFEVYKNKRKLPINHNLVRLADFDRQKTKRQNKNHNKAIKNESDYEYNLPHINTISDFRKLHENFSYQTVTANITVRILEQMVNALKNLPNCTNDNCSKEKKIPLEDPCQKWINYRKPLDQIFTGGNHRLPSCPCTYPTFAFYNEMIWDQNQKKYFRWKDASNEAERLDIYKPGASYCIRSLLTQRSLSVSSQQCCYDRHLQLLTRGSGAGTINFISPDVSKKLHYTIDILPWRLCKGDFTRYNMARNPNNGNNCLENPNEEQYQLQVKLSKIF